MLNSEHDLDSGGGMTLSMRSNSEALFKPDMTTVVIIDGYLSIGVLPRSGGC